MKEKLDQVIGAIPRRPTLLTAAGVGLAAAVSGISYLLFRNIASPSLSLHLSRLPGIALTALSPDLQFLYHGEPLHQLSLIPVRLKNTGDRLIERHDVVSSIIIGSDPQVELVAAHILPPLVADADLSLEILQAGYHTRLHIDRLPPGGEVMMGFAVAGEPDTHLYLSGGKLAGGGAITFGDEVPEPEQAISR